MDDFKAITFRGFRWSVIGQVGSQAVSLVFSILIARIVVPDDFGQVAMVTVITGFLSVIVNSGFGSALIQKTETSQKLLSSAFWFNLILGVIMTAMLILSRNLIARFYEVDSLSYIALLLSPIFIFHSLGSVSRSILAKRIEFRMLSLAGLTSMIVSGSVALYLASIGLATEALVANVVLQALISNILILILCRWRPSLAFSLTELKEVFNFSLNILGNDSLNFWVRNVDSLLIGKYLDSHSLGIYNRSYSLLTIPLTNVSGAISKVLFPSLSSIKGDSDRVKSIYLRVVGTISFILYPALIGLMVTADKIVITILGENWIEAIPLIRVFAMLGMVQSISSLVTNLYLSQGKVKLMFRLGTALRVMLIFSFIVGLNWGIMGVAVSYTIAALFSALINNYFGGKQIGLTLDEIFARLASSFWLSALVGVEVVCADLLIQDFIGIHWRLLIQVSLGIFSYYLLNEIFKPKNYIFLKNAILSKG